jgi:phosphate-selective porin OprO/OprP
MSKITLTLATVLLSMVFSNAQTTEKEVKFGGRIMYDMAAWGAEGFDYTGSEFRRVRLYSSGKMYGTVKYKLQLDFSGGKISFKDVWMELNKLPIQGNLRVGHFKEPLRLEALTSSKYITFMERGLPIAMSPERNTGAMYHTTIGEKLSLQTGVFRQSDAFGNDKTANNNINITSRVTYLAINDGDKLLHLGVANSKRKSDDKTYSFSTRAENHLGNKLMDVEFNNQVKDINIIAGEIAYVNGSLSLQAEALQTNINTEIGQWNTPNDHEIISYYAQVSYFLTGESRSYKSSLAGFGRVNPKNNYGENGWGAIEVAARFSAIDMQEDGSLEDITIGLNWYLNPNTRVMLNYVMGEITNGAEPYNESINTTENAVMMRVQLDF